MVERIIFDLDGTLISNVDFNVYVKKAFDDVGYHYTSDSLKNVQLALHDYELNEKRYDQLCMMKYLKEYVGSDLSDDFLKYFVLELYNAVPDKLEDGVVETLEYLSTKYKLTVLTNWFLASQEKRLLNTDLLKYFDHVFSGEIYSKPSKEAYRSACLDTKYDHALMVGDSYEVDYLGAKNAGLKSILLDKKNQYVDKINEKERIVKFSDLKNIL